MKKKLSNIQFHTVDTVFKKVARSKEFQIEYSEELMRLRLASTIRTLRTEKNLTQEAVAKKASMPQSVIARVEGGKHSMSLGTLNRIAVALGAQVQLA